MGGGKGALAVAWRLAVQAMAVNALTAAKRNKKIAVNAVNALAVHRHA